jgi:hypothetical protein
MTHPPQFTRRATLGLAAGCGVAALIPLAAVGTEGLAARAVRLFSSPHHAARVGLSCIRCGDGRATREALVEDLFGTDRQELARADDAQVHGWLRTRIRRDFSAGETIKVEGWILSRTEARLYALASTV